MLDLEILSDIVCNIIKLACLLLYLTVLVPSENEL